MPVEVSYPGVYIEEVPSGARTIVGVATSIAAFLGRAEHGPPDEPVEVNGLGEFEREFGKVSPDYPLSLAVRDFFLNGGGRAVVVRLYKPPGEGDGAAVIPLGTEDESLQLRAVSPGTWGGWLRLEAETVTPDGEFKQRLGLTADDVLFRLTVRDLSHGLEERLENLVITLRDHPRRVDKALETESRLVRWQPAGDATAWPDKKENLPTLANDATDPVTAAETTQKLDEKTQVVAQARKELILAQAKQPPDPDAVETAQEALDTAQENLDTALAEVKDAQDALGASDGGKLATAADYPNDRDAKTGLYALEKTDLFNLLCIPPDTRDGTTPEKIYQDALAYCVERRALLIVDPPATWSTVDQAVALTGLNLSGQAARNAALYFPRLLQADPESQEGLLSAVPCGAVAGIMARTDAQRGVWKAPAGIDASLNGVQGFALKLADSDSGRLNDKGINGLHSFPVTGNVVWGARTLRGAKQLGDEYRYVPVRRLALFLEESLYRGTKWVVFEPNDEPLWAQIRLNVGAFLQNLFRQGAFQGRSPREAYFVKCDKDTTTQNDINLGIVNVLVGFAPLKPAEFVILKIQQLAGQIEA